MIVTPTTLFSQRAEPAPLWLRTFLKRYIRRGTTRISRVRCNKAKRGCASRVPPVARRNGPPYGRDAGGESDPTLFGAGAPRGRAKGDRGRDTLWPPCGEVALTTEIPGGKAVESDSKPTRTTTDHRWPQAERGKVGGGTQSGISDRQHRQLASPIDGLGRSVFGVESSQNRSVNVLNGPMDSGLNRGIQ